jgi:hypothetical protein
MVNPYLAAALALIVETVTKGWPLAALIIAVVLRTPLFDLLGRIQHIQGGGWKFDLSAERQAAATAEVVGRELPKATTKGTTSTIEEDQWRKCGEIYWLANNIMFTAFAIVAGDATAARREFEHAIHNAREIPIPEEFINTMDTIGRRNWSDVSTAKTVIDDLVQIGWTLGGFFASHQPGFNPTFPAE